MLHLHLPLWPNTFHLLVCSGSSFVLSSPLSNSYVVGVDCRSCSSSDSSRYATLRAINRARSEPQSVLLSLHQPPHALIRPSKRMNRASRAVASVTRTFRRNFSSAARAQRAAPSARLLGLGAFGVAAGFASTWSYQPAKAEECCSSKPKVQEVLHTDLKGLKKIYQGKVRDIYEVDEDSLLHVATDRLSAFDVIMLNGIPVPCTTHIHSHTFARMPTWSDARVAFSLM